jgi:hypothetical protein
VLPVRDDLCETGLSVRELALTALGIALFGLTALDVQVGQEYLLQPFPLH